MKNHHIAIGSDLNGLKLKSHLVQYLRRQSLFVEDFGISDDEDRDYPEIAYEVAKAVSTGSCPRGILICGTGIGMAITANKIPGIRAAVCHDLYSAERSRLSNDCQILALGARIITPKMAESVLKLWLQAEFKDGRSTPKLKKIAAIEAEMSATVLPVVENRFG